MKIKVLFSVFFLLFVGFHANARVIYRATTTPLYIDQTDPFFTTATRTQDFDIDLDGVNDFFWKQSNNIPQYTSNLTCLSAPSNYTETVLHWLTEVESYNNTNLVFTYTSPNLIPNSTEVSWSSHTYSAKTRLCNSTKLTWSPTNCFGNTSSMTYSIEYTQSGYFVGFKLIKNGLVYFGYLKINAGRIIAIAYETIPGFSIFTGDQIGKFSTSYNTNSNVIKGKVYVDANSNCSFDNGEVGISDVVVTTTNGNFGGITDAQGNYEIIVPGTATSYTLDIVTNSNFGVTYTKVCPVTTLNVTFSGSNQTIINKNFSITSCVNLKVNLEGNRRRRCFKNNTYVDYRNQGTTASTGTELKVVLPKYVKAISSVPSWDAQIGDTLLFSIGTLQAFESGHIVIIDSVVCGDESIRGVTQCTKAIISPKTYCNTGSWDLADVFVEGKCTNSRMNCSLSNKGAAMQDSTNFRIFLDGVVVSTHKIKLGANETKKLDVPCHGKAIRIEVDQTISHPEIKTRSFSYEGCGDFVNETISKGVINQLPTNQGGFAVAESCMPILDSYDPNDKNGMPHGFDNDHKMLSNGEMEYTIRFQNTGNDEAYTVVIADTLDANFDANSLRVEGASHNYKLEITGKDSPRLVFIFGGIHLPDSITNEPASHGFITFKVAQKPGLPVGTVLKNKAYIFFDFNSAILTNETSHTITDSYTQNILAITTQPTPQQTCENGAASFTAASTGYGLASYVWLKDGSILPGETNSTLSMSNVSTFNQASYICRIENGIDTLYTAPANLTVTTCNSTIEELATNLNLKLYPNPTIDKLIIDSKAAFEFSMLDAKGKEVHRGFFKEGINEVDVRNDVSGLYTVVITMGGKRYGVPIIKQ